MNLPSILVVLLSSSKTELNILCIELWDLVVATTVSRKRSRAGTSVSRRFC